MINLELRQGLIASLADLEAGDTVLVGLSGGADSLSLLKCAVMVGKIQSINVGAIIIDHQIQAESAKTSQTAAQLATDLGADPVLIFNVNVATGPGSGGMEAAARSARYKALDDEADLIGAVAIFLGHTEDDLAETVVLGLARGSGTRSLSGMAFHVGRYVRPFLELTRAQVLAACKESGIEFWSDPQNDDLSFARVRVRNELLPKMEKEIGPGISKALARTSRILREDADALDLIAGDLFATLVDPAQIPIELISELPSAVRKRVIKRAIEAMGAPTLTAEQILEVDALVGAWKGQGAVALAGGITVRRDSGRLTLSK